MLRIGGLQKFSLIDYPGKVAAVVFTQGCDFRCPFCQNVNLVLSEKFSDAIGEEAVLDFLKTRQGQLQGVVVTGGEPTIQKDLGVFLSKIKELGFLVKLDTNGNNPDAVKEFVDKKLIDYIAMDVKAPLKKYDESAGIAVDKKNILKSINLIMTSGLDYHFRTTVCKAFLSSEDIKNLLEIIKGAKRYDLQKFSYQSGILDSSLLDKPDYTADEFEQLAALYSVGIETKA
ncbi:MAG: anaerobic ribonucleoside-triphosphate reductase activating protein [Candidatus Aceula meridiana]|nr:anaerobic ribonucleoside-triphosphate reductase activating protein [Candidatus Aceula meridiana]